jgi:hypothetical protein
MSKGDYEQEKTNYSNSKHGNEFLENNFLIRLEKPTFSASNTDDVDQVQHYDENTFTDLQSCSIPIDTDSGKNRLSKVFCIRFLINQWQILHDQVHQLLLRTNN